LYNQKKGKATATCWVKKNRNPVSAPSICPIKDCQDREKVSHERYDHRAAAVTRREGSFELSMLRGFSGKKRMKFRLSRQEGIPEIISDIRQGKQALGEKRMLL